MQQLELFEGFPEPFTGCMAPCGGTGFVPVRLPIEDQRLYWLWRAMETFCNESSDGWHFVPCPDCHPEAERLLNVVGYKAD